jgi:hypothetical protein
MAQDSSFGRSGGIGRAFAAHEKRSRQDRPARTRDEKKAGTTNKELMGCILYSRVEIFSQCRGIV